MPATEAPSRWRAEAGASASRLPPLLLAAERIAATVEQGVHGRRRTGPGEVFWQYRLYSPGDELRRLDWRASARSDRLYLRQTEWAAAQSAWLWCDLSPSMRYASRRDLPEKAERALVLGLALGHLLTRAGERIALLGRAEPPLSGRAAVLRLAAQLERLAAGAAAAPSLPPADTAVPAHAAIILIGDFLEPPEAFAAAIALIAARSGKGHLLQVLDPAETGLPFSGRLRFAGLEGEGQVTVGRAESLRDAYRAGFAGHSAALAEVARRAGWSHALHLTSEPPAAALLAAYRRLAAERPGRR